MRASGILALCLSGFLAAPASAFWFGSEPEPSEVTLADYKGMSQRERGQFLESALPLISEEAAGHAEKFRACLGYNAPIKNEDLTALKVLGWCDADRKNNPTTFAGYFNNLEAEDHSGLARFHCRERTKQDLLAPATADFAMFDRSELHLGSWEYQVDGSVESENAFGVTFAFRFYCTLQFKGEGDPGLTRNWTLSSFALEPA